MLLDFSAVRDGRSAQVFTVEPDDPLLQGLPGRAADPLRLTAEIREGAGRSYVVDLELEGELEAACRRCLEPVRQAVRERLRLVAEVGSRHRGVRGVEDAPDDPEDDLLVLRSPLERVEIGPRVREALFLAAETWPLCRPDCRGLCPTCGADLNRGPCACGGGPAEVGARAGGDREAGPAPART